MSLRDDISRKWTSLVPLRRLRSIDWDRQEPTYRQARPSVIDAALDRSQSRPSGNWYVFAASRRVGGDKPFGTTVGGIEIVAWRDEQQRLHVGPGACPHLGAPLSDAAIHCGALICRWHGLRLGNERTPNWKTFPSHDDGVLAWVRLDQLGGDEPLDHPVIVGRPARTELHAVTNVVGVCEPADIIANRLDPWHGGWFHPYSFTQLEVLDSPPPSGTATAAADRFLVDVTFRVGKFGVPVRAEFTSPEPRTLVMRITDGEGTGSLVETHATPLGPGLDGRPRTAVIEAVIATSDRPKFEYARRMRPLIAPLMRRAADRLWRDDLAYAERLYRLRTQRLTDSL
ncbi:DUF5914 domain-containing protein [Antrihabitans cavernicola]|uniref:Rieske (2Fe-2S) protein n=1 Tax=Antrihabitans cavernicola TaxID=2495913 RepID=A0A5A7S7Z2_9NOCA|nr:DUF5914 domain-containing protein [Spelaeibacter cavernicola]KAA0022278.1 Rieske (2Fe-2S) protein [Spelaeibacter cavernicola]